MRTAIISSSHAGLVYSACFAELTSLVGRVWVDIVPDTKGLGVEYHGIGQEA